MNWTKNQQNAIDARGERLLVAAAAGSGKTAVLTERVKNILTNTDEPCGVDEILCATFTRAAASELRSKIANALTKAVAESDSGFHRHQLAALPTADICTIDSFCGKLVRDNFHKAGVSVDFTLMDGEDEKTLMEETCAQIIESYYEEDDADFLALVKQNLTERDDSLLVEIITKLYTFSRSFESPKKWLDTLCQSYSPSLTPPETPNGKFFLDYIILMADYYIKAFNKAIDMMASRGGFENGSIPKREMDIERLKELSACAKAGSWDSCVSLLRGGVPSYDMGRNANGYDKELGGLVDKVAESYISDIKSLGKMLPLSDEHKDDCEYIYPSVCKLCELVEALSDALDEKKRENNAYSHSDILHKCIALLVERINPDGTFVKKELAESLGKKYKHIFLDEYQDTNNAQDIIFRAISRDESNLFCVGDVKQSIYGFRLANPQLFMNLRNTLPEYKKGVNVPSQITLDSNFRSRRGITEAVNFIFSRIMSAEVGEVDYIEREYLTYGNGYTEKATPDVEVLCIDAQDRSTGEALELEARQIAKYIKNKVRSGVELNNGKKLRYGDFAILLRSAKNRSGVYADALASVGIPVETVNDSDASESKEIMLLMALVRAVNNPADSISLCAVMLSALFGFTPDELAELRISDRSKNIYSLLCDSVQTEKVAHFLSKLKLYRNIAASCTVCEFVDFIVNDTGIEDVFSACENGDERKADIRGFVSLAEKFTSNGGEGLGSFIRYMENAQKRKQITPAATHFGNSDSVKIMTIHKSKGLEYPYVIIANCNKGKYMGDATSQLTFSQKTGLGMMIHNDETFSVYDTLSSAATEKSILVSSASEELRILYVAMTRAKEHLVFACTFNDDKPRATKLKKAVKIFSMFSYFDGKMHPYAVYKASTYIELVLGVLTCHENCEIIRELTDNRNVNLAQSNFAVDVSLLTDDCDIDVEREDFSIKTDNALLARIKEKCSYEYGYNGLSGVLAKRTASSTEQKGTQREFFASAVPQFESGYVRGSDRGTAIHKFLELCDFESVSKNITAEADRLLNEGLITETELSVLDRSAVGAFFSLPIVRRMLKSERVFKEYEFSVLRKAGELYPNLSPNEASEQIVVEGKLDCAFEENGKAVLIDYKTDGMTDESEYIRIYKEQLEIYADALTQCTELPVDEVYIYSFKLKKFIPMRNTK